MQKINELQLAKELMKFPSITPRDAGVMKFLDKKLKKIGFKTKILNFKEKNFQPVKNLYARLGSKGPNFCFAGHLDVVPPGNIKDWTVNPFRPSIKKGHLIGRGANDMKGSVAAFVSAVSIFLNNNKNFTGSISLLITGDEEGDAVNGTKKVVDYLKKRKEKINFCLVGEPTNPNKLGEMIKIGRRGSLTGKIEIIGMQGHVAYPEKVINPILLSGDLISKLKNKVWDDGNEAFDPTSFQISNISSGTGAHNVVPGELELTFNFRFSTESTEDSLKFEFESILKDLELDYELSWDLNGNPYYTKDNFFKDIVCASSEEITGYKPELNAKGGTSDGRFVAAMNTEIVELGPVNKSIHQIDEHVSVNDLWKLKDIYEKILINLNQSL